MKTPKTRQVAALPVKLSDKGNIRVLLVTSRETKRWVIPKGWPWSGRSDADAAAGEALEEAGIKGVCLTEPVGMFSYEKRRRSGNINVTVSVHLLVVTRQLKSWPEQEERERKWVSQEVAASMVVEPDLKALILDLRATTIAKAVA